MEAALGRNMQARVANRAGRRATDRHEDRAGDQPGLAALQSAATLRAMVAALRLSDTVVRPVDALRRPLETYQRPFAPRSSRPHSRGEVTRGVLKERFSMTRNSANQMRFDPRPRPSFHRFNAGDDSVRVLLVAIRHALQPAAFLGSHPLQRLQVLLAAPGEEDDLNPLNAMARAPAGAAPQLLPQLTVAGAVGARPRLVQGEILSDDDGRYYEKVGRRIRPLQRLFSGPRGEVLELPSEARAEAEAEQREPSPQAPDADASKTEAQPKPRLEAPPRRPQPSQRPFHRPPQRPREAFGAPFVVPPSGGRGVMRGPLPVEGATPNARRQSPPEGGTQNAGARCLKTTIPEQWLKPWEFQISREEALYDMLADASSRSAPLAFIRGLTDRFGHPQAWRKWQALLAGKSLDEQLWAVRPPRGLISSAAVRDWARQMLEQAGYDPRVMLAEWEIFWRRRGL